MRKLLLIITCIFLIQGAKAQDGEFLLHNEKEQKDEVKSKPKNQKKTQPSLYKIGLGLEYSFPFASFSVKLGISAHSVLQATFSPSNYGDYNLSYYGVRYNYLFKSYKVFGPNSDGIPFLFAGAGIISWSYNNSGYPNEPKTTYSDLGYSAGVGYEVIFSHRFGIALEAGYGAFSASDASVLMTPTGGLGLHYYFGGVKKGGSGYQGTLPMGKEHIENSTDDEDKENEEDNKNNQKPADKKKDSDKE